MVKVFFAALLIFTTHLYAQPVNQKDSLQQDLSLLQNTLQQQYPSLYRYNSKASLDVLFDSCYNAIQNTTTPLSFFSMVKFLVSTLKDGHLSCSPSPALRQQLKEQGNFIPLRLRFQQNKAYLQSSVNNLPAGTALIAINHQSIDSIKNILFHYIVADGDIETKKRIILGNYFYFYYYLVFSGQSNFEITYQLANGSTGSTIIQAAAEKTIPAPIAEPTNEKLLNLSFTPDSIAVLTIQTFDKGELTSANLNFETFLQCAFTTLREKQVKKLVIDLRGNGGGRDLYGSLLYSYLARAPFHYYKSLTAATDHLPFDQFTRAYSSYNDLTPGMLLKTAPQHFQLKKEAHANLGVIQPVSEPYTHDVWFLINGLSFSTTAEFCAIARSQRRGSFIGEETGGGYCGNTSGFQTELILPNTKLTVSFGLIQYELAVNNDRHNARGIMPDHELQPSMNDLLSGRDVQLEYTLALIRKISR